MRVLGTQLTPAPTERLNTHVARDGALQHWGSHFNVFQGQAHWRYDFVREIYNEGADVCAVYANRNRTGQLCGTYAVVVAGKLIKPQLPKAMQLRHIVASDNSCDVQICLISGSVVVDCKIDIAEWSLAEFLHPQEQAPQARSAGGVPRRGRAGAASTWLW